MKEEYIVQLKNISKNFKGIIALDNMELNLKKNEIHGLVGENGAGKSTLIKILSGAHEKSSGEIIIDGEVIGKNNPRKAIELGISVIYQEFELIPDLTVAENIFIDKLTQNNLFINKKTIKREAKKILKKIDFDEINPNTLVKNLSVAHQQIVEICKSLSRNSKVLVLDEPTAVLTFSEANKLFKLLKSLKNEGISIIYISHRLEELFKICDTVTIMKDGKFVDEYDIETIDKQDLIKGMVGRDLDLLFPGRSDDVGEIVLEVKNLSHKSKFENISFEVKKGEVVGFSGLVGAGRTEVMESIFGIEDYDSGEIIYNGEKLDIKTPSEAVENKMGFVPEDRKNKGVLLDLSIKNNVTFTLLNKITKYGFINFNKELSYSKELLAKLNTKYGSVLDPVSSLSGGNQQKVALSKWLAANCELIIFDEPTRGVDVGAKVEIYNIINELAEIGVAIIMVSSEMEEIINMCDRTYVMHQGKINGELSKSEMTEVNIMELSVEG